MKYNYSFLHRPALLCLALIWLALQADIAFAQTRANGTPVQPGGSASSNRKLTHDATAPLLSGAEIVVSPPAVGDTLNTGGQSTKQVTVQNTGTDTLLFRAGALPRFGPRPGPIRVLAVFNDESMASQVPLLFARAPDIQLSVFPTFPYNGQFTAAYLASFDVVFLGNSNPFGWAGQDTRELIGNVLADYVDAGGHVIMTAHTYSDDNPTGLAGRFVEEQYGPVLPTPPVGIPGPATLGAVVKPDHPFMQGVTGLSYEGTGSVFALAHGAEDIAYFSNGAMLVAANPHVAAVNMSFAWDNHNQIRFWDGDIDILMQNIVRYFKASQVISVKPVHGTIAPGGQRTLDVTFDATGLDSATYIADLEIYSNATDTLVTIPLTLVVTGNDILFQPDTLKEALHKDQTSARTFTITNNSPDDHTFTVSGVPVYTTVSPLSGNIASGESATITVNFSSLGLDFDTYPDAISFNVDGTEWQAPVSLYVFDDPAIEVSVTELHDTLAYREESVQTFMIHNTGGSTLNYSLALVENSNNPQAARFVASVALLEENFDGPLFPPQGWTTPSDDDQRKWLWNTDWVLNNSGYYDNYAGTGKSAMIGEDYSYPSFEYNASLVTPEISTSGYRHFAVSYNASFVRNFDDSLSLELQVNNGNWQTVLIWNWMNDQHGVPFGLPGEAVSIPLDDYIDSTATSFRVRWRYARNFGSENFWYGQIDDVVISGERRQWLNVVPETGSIAPGETATLTANFDAEETLPGLYTGELQISSNDPQQPLVSIPASLYVTGGDQNTAPVLQRPDTVEAIEYGEETLVLKATDADNEAVIVSIKNAPSFVTLTSSANGSATYTIKPQPGDVGEYALDIVARDARGKNDSTVCHLSVLAYGASKYLVRNSRTGEVLYASADSVVIDLASIGHKTLEVQAETKPAQVGSVRFWWDDHVVNIDNGAPYTLKLPFLSTVRVERHILKTQAFTKPGAKGSKGTVQEVVVRLINSSAVTGLDAVRINGDVLFALENDAIVSDRLADWLGAGVKANINGSAVKSVVFRLNGNIHRIDNAAPYTVNANRFGYDLPWLGKPGWYTLEAVPYSSLNGQGIAGKPLTVTFQVKSGSGTAREFSEDGIIAGETAGVRFSVYPVPVSDVLHIDLPAGEEGHVRLMIHDVQGKAFYTREGEARTFQDHTVSTEKAGLTTGFYYIQVQYSNGKREVRKFLKE